MKYFSTTYRISLLLFTSMAHAQQGIDTAIDVEQQYQLDAQGSQSRIESLDDETMSSVASYNRELERYEDLVTYNENMRQLLASQEAERNRIQGELAEIENVRRALVPLMVEMVEVLGQFVELDQPMLIEERSARVRSLQSIITRADVDIAEKYRRVIESYQIEAEYGQSLESYEGVVTLDGRERTVDFLRVGRVGLYYLTLDRSSAGIWNNQSATWELLPAQYTASLDYAVRIALEQAPPNLIELPMWSGEAMP